MAKKDVVEAVTDALERAQITGAKIHIESLARLTNSGFRGAGYRVRAVLPETASSEQRRLLHAAVLDDYRLHSSYCPMEGKLDGIWSEGR